jgi:TetR/AcrR family transcriptional regulator, fatty acid metabolism regulator protein
MGASFVEKNGLTKRQIQAHHTKNKIYHTATELMKQKDYQDIKIEEICERAEVSVGSFYHYFKSKNDLLIEMYCRADDYFQNEVRVKLVSTDPLERIVEYFDAYAEYNEMTGISTMKQLYNSSNRLFIAKNRDMQNVLQSIISQGQFNKQIGTDYSSEEITEYLFIAARGVIYDWCLHDGNYDLKEKMHTYIKRLVILFRS